MVVAVKAAEGEIPQLFCETAFIVVLERHHVETPRRQACDLVMGSTEVKPQWINFTREHLYII